MQRARRFCVLAVVAALTLSVPLRTPNGCVVCPPGCPMHARAAAGIDEPERKVGCHRAPAPPRPDVCMRSACGRDAETGAAAVLLGVLAGIRVAAAPPPPVALRRTAVRVASALAPEPPTEPPRALPA